MQTDTVVLDPEWFRTYNRLGLGSNPTGLILLTIAGWIMIFNDRLAGGDFRNTAIHSQDSIFTNCCHSKNSAN